LILPQPEITFDWSQRAPDPELMDQPCSYDELRDCLRDLEKANRLTFTYRPTLSWLSRLPRFDRPLHIVDIGCGGGDMLRAIRRWAERRKVPVRLTGIDLNPYAASIADERTSAAMEIEWLTGDVFGYAPAEGVDIFISSLLTHHLTNSEIVDLLRWQTSSARVGWFVNDLHREPNPFRAFQLLARVMKWHPFVRHDGPLSIRRSFQPEDWRQLCRGAGIPLYNVDIRKYWPARLCVGWLR
jgi:SAM-dependent methyltransferase